MLEKTLAVAALACLLAGCDSPKPTTPGRSPVSIDQPQEFPDCPNRDDTSTACR